MSAPLGQAHVFMNGRREASMSARSRGRAPGAPPPSAPPATRGGHGRVSRDRSLTRARDSARGWRAPRARAPGEGRGVGPGGRLAGGRLAVEPSAAGGRRSACRVEENEGRRRCFLLRETRRRGRGARAPRNRGGAASWGRWPRAPTGPWWLRAVVGAAALRPGAAGGRGSRGADARGAQQQT